MSQGEKESYIKMVIESARNIWGVEETEKFRDHIKLTAQAVYNLSSYPLEPEIQPVIMLRHSEENESL